MSSTAPYDIGRLITCTPGVYGGRACLEGTRYPITHVALHYQEGMLPEEIAGEYSLPLSHVYAGIAYYLANKELVDLEIETTQKEYDALYAEYLASDEFNQLARKFNLNPPRPC